MIIAGSCLINEDDIELSVKTAENLVGVADIFRTKLFGGGTRLETWMAGIGETMPNYAGEVLKALKLPVMMEVQDREQVDLASKHGFHGVWLGARNSQNYALLQYLWNNKYQKESKGFNFLKFMFKRGAGMTIEEVVNMFNLWRDMGKVTPYIIERGINTIDRATGGRWAPDLKIAYYLKHNEPEIFEKLIIDCSHSAGDKRYVADIYNAFKAIGVQHFMFEVLDGESKTDKPQIITSKELKDILNV